MATSRSGVLAAAGPGVLLPRAWLFLCMAGGRHAEKRRTLHGGAIAAGDGASTLAASPRWLPVGVGGGWDNAIASMATRHNSCLLSSRMATMASSGEGKAKAAAAQTATIDIRMHTAHVSGSLFVMRSLGVIMRRVLQTRSGKTYHPLLRGHPWRRPLHAVICSESASYHSWSPRPACHMLDAYMLHLALLFLCLSTTIATGSYQLLYGNASLTLFSAILCVSERKSFC